MLFNIFVIILNNHLKSQVMFKIDTVVLPSPLYSKCRVALRQKMHSSGLSETSLEAKDPLEKQDK